MDKSVDILISGRIDLQTIGRQVIGFIGALLHDDRNNVYLDELWYEDKSINILEEIWGKKLVKKIKRSKDLPREYEYDFMIYPWIFGYGFSEKFAPTLERKSKIKVCYPVYDGSVPPLEWIPIINKHFDICVTPSDYCAHNLKRYGVDIDCFGLELIVLIRELLNTKTNKYDQQKKFRFGCVSASENRKNLPLLIKSFTKAFSKNDNVELFIKTTNRGDIFSSIDDLKHLVNESKNQNPNIILETDFYNHSKMISLLSSFDAYINPQKTVGFYTSSIEMFALGKPMILSDIPVHNELDKFINIENNIFFVKHPLMELELHAAFNYRPLGVRFQSNEEEYINTFQLFYSKRNELYNDTLIQERKKCANYFINDLIKKYNTITHPKAFAISDKPYIKDNVFFMSKRLFKLYKSINPNIHCSTIKNTYDLRRYPEEENPLFKILEDVSVKAQKMSLNINNTLPIYQSKYMKKITSLSEKYKINKIPHFVYTLFKIYTKFKHVWSK